MRRSLSLIAALSLISSLISCRSPQKAATDAASPPTLDGLRLQYKQKLPRSQRRLGSGRAIHCANPSRQDDPALLDLDDIAESLPIASDSDLPKLVPWLRDDDTCIRQIGLVAVHRRLPHDERAFTAEDPEGWEIHDALVVLKKHLDAKHVAYEQELFAGLMLTIDEAMFGVTMQGAWETMPQSPRRFTFDIDASKKTMLGREPMAITAVRVNDRQQWEVVTTTAGTWTFWPINATVVWFLVPESKGFWLKLRRPSGISDAGGP